MATKWKIFRAANYTQLIISLSLLFIVAYRFFVLNAHVTFDIFFFLFILMLIIAIGNNCINLHIMGTNFPDRALSNLKKTFFHISFGFYILVTIALLLLEIYGLSEELAADHIDFSRDVWIFLALLSMFVLLSIFIAVNQTGLPKLIYENNRRSLLQMMDDIGTT